MKIVHAVSEMFPFVKTGGLADYAGSLTKALSRFGHEVAVFVPGYRIVLDHPELARAESRLVIRVEMGDEFLSGEVIVLQLAKRLTLFVIRRDEFFDRRQPYGCDGRDYDDNDRRFIFFAKSVVEVLRIIDFKADFLHCHDWQTGLTPLMLRYEEGRLRETLALKTIFTIHNISFQGVFPHRSFFYTGLPSDVLAVDGIEFYGQISMMKGGILFADQVTTVSPNYSREICTPEFGFGLDGVIRSRADDLTGLINGVDMDVWNPKTDTLLPARYSVKDLSGKKTCRRHLLRAHRFDADFEGPVFGMVCRLSEQKGIDLLLESIDFFIENDCRLVILGRGERKYERALSDIAEKLPDKVSLSLVLDEEMSHLVEAGSDFFLMPSIFEPCGLNQMYSQIYGTVPIVTRVGGLVDTVVDLADNPKKGTGLMCKPTGDDLRRALDDALTLFSDGRLMAAVQKRGMKTDFSWKVAARHYEELYRRLI
jgi:starch synthase